MNPLVSVIVPVYRVEKYLAVCLDSIRTQTYRNLQVIVVDDGSPDACPAICDSFAARDGRFQVIHQANVGLSGARNAGLDAATGDHIAFVDSDDAVAPACIETLLAAGADIAQCTFCTDESGLSQAFIDPVFRRATGRQASEFLQFDGTGNFTVVWNKLYRADLWRDVRFPQGRHHEDEFVTYRLLWEADSFACTDTPLYYYRQREGSIMSGGITERSLDAIDALEGRAAFYRERGEEGLALLTECVELHRVQGLFPSVREALPHEADQLSRLAHTLFRRLIRDSRVPLRKKASLTLRMRQVGKMGPRA